MAFRGRTRVLVLLLAGVLAGAGAARAEEEEPEAAAPAPGTPSLEDILGGFESDDAALEPTPRSRRGVLAELLRDLDRRLPWHEHWDLSGALTLGSSFNYLRHRSTSGTQYEGVSQLRTELDLQLDVDLPRGWKGRVAGRGFYDFSYFIRGQDEYTHAVLNDYEWEIDFTEVWVQGTPFEDLDLKIGRQIVNWGRSENIRVLDVLNPLDLREPGLVDVEDLRRPVGMIRADYYLGDWDLTLIAIPEQRFDELPPYGSDFHPGPRLPPEKTPRQNLGNTEWAVALQGIFRGWDVSFHYARIYQERPVVRYTGTPPALRPHLRHGRLHMFGVGGNYTWGNWLVKGELAWFDGVEYTNVLDEHGRLDVLGGLEYYGFEETTIVFEVANRHIQDFESAMRRSPDLDEENRLEWSFRFTREFLNARLRATLVALVVGERAQRGSTVRLQAEYELRDAVDLTAGIVLFQNGEGQDPFFGRIGRNDRLFADLRWSF